MVIETPGRFVVFCEKYSQVLLRRLFRLRKKISGVSRPSSYPYVTGDSFRALADHIHDETGVVKHRDVKTGDIVFVGNEHILHYLQQIHPYITNQYILIEHNGDNSIGKNVMDLIDEKIFRFYAQDAVYPHDRLIPIPIGLENLHYHVNGITSAYKKMLRKIENCPPERKNRIFFNFSISTNPAERAPAKEYFFTHPLMDTVKKWVSPLLHAKILMTYKFVVSPPGHAIESSRTWEALYLKTVPIVKDFVAMRYFSSIGLPIWIVKDWFELNNLTEKDLAMKYDSFIKNANWDALHMNFWIKKIKDDQKNVRINGLKV